MLNAHMLRMMTSDVRGLWHTFVFVQSEIQMKRVTMEEGLMVHRNHAVFSIWSNIDIKQCSVRSMCSASVATGGNLILIVDASVLVDVFSAVMIAGKNAYGSLKSYII